MARATAVTKAPAAAVGIDAETQSAAAMEAGETEYEIADPDFVTADYDAYETESQERRARGAVVKPEAGKSTWRILPPIKGTKLLFFRAWTHSVNNEVLSDIVNMLAAIPDEARAQVAKELGVMDIDPTSLGEGFKATLCASKMANEECFLCKTVSILGKLGRSSQALKQASVLAGEIRSKEEFFCNAVRIDKKEEMEKGPRILQLVMGLYEKLNRMFKDPETGGDFSHPEKGFNVVIDRIVDDTKTITLGNGKTIPKTTYDASASRNSSRIPNMDWLKHMHDLRKAREAADDTALRGIFEGTGKARQQQQAPAQVPPPKGQKQIAGAPGGMSARTPAPAGAADDSEWIEDPLSPGDYDSRGNLRAKGRAV